MIIVLPCYTQQTIPSIRASLGGLGGGIHPPLEISTLQNRILLTIHIPSPKMSSGVLLSPLGIFLTEPQATT